MKTAQTRLADFDCLRGLAATLIGLQLCLEFLIFKMWDYSSTSLPRVLVYDFNASVAGSSLFWLLSGFFVFSSLRHAPSLMGFVAQRLLRFYPAFLIAFALVLPLAEPIPFKLAIRDLVLMHVPVVARTFSEIHGIVTVVVLFYAMCCAPALVGWLRSPTYLMSMSAGLFLVLLIMLVVGHVWHLHFPIRLLLGLALAHLGAITRLYLEGGDSRIYWRFVLFFFIATLLVCRFAWSTAWGAGELWMGQALGFGTALLLFLAVSSGIGTQVRLLSWLGTLSYELYLIFPALLAASRFAVGYDTVPQRLTAILASILLALPLAWALRRYVSQFAMMPGQRLIGRFISSKPASVD